MSARVSGKVAVVTGAARGMGATHARRLVEEGAQVVLTDLLQEEGKALANALGANARFVFQDVGKEEDWKRVIRETEAAFGLISVLVNNAGVGAGFGPLETLEEAEYRRVIDVNQVSVFLGMKSAIPSMKRAGGGSIINISSVCGIVGTAFAHPYTAAKFAIRGMTKSAAIELAPYGIRVNSIHPGLIRTPATKVKETEQAQAALLAETPAGRLGEPEEVANLMLLLASDESRFATGAEFVVDGGFSCR